MGTAVEQYAKQQAAENQLQSESDAALRQMIGKHIDAAIHRLGFPDAERTIAGKRLVVWETKQIDSAGGEPFTAECKVLIEIDAHKRVRGTQIRGNVAGCRQYREALASSSKSATR